MHLSARVRVFGFVTLSAIVSIACSDDPAPATPGTQNGADGGTSSSSGSTSGSTSSSGGTVVEPTCTATAGEPAWAPIDHKLDWTRPASAGPLDPTENGAIGLAYGNGVFVLLAVSSDQTRIRWATSTDGQTWTEHMQNVTVGAHYSSGAVLHFTGKKFVFIGSTDQGSVAYSSADGLTWEEHKVDANAPNVTAMATSADGVTVAVGANGANRSSPDLVTWTSHPVSGIASYLNVAWQSGRFVATSNASGTVVGSADGATWTPITIPGTQPGGFANLYAGRGLFLMPTTVPQILISTDGQTFTPSDRTGTDRGAKSNDQSRFAGNRFVNFHIDGTGQATFASTTDGKAWEDFGKADLGIADGYPVPVMVAFGQCRYVALAAMSKDGNLHTKFALLGAASSPAP